MADWLLLVNDKLTTKETVTALRVALPLPWGSVVILAAMSRWQPLTSGVPLRYRTERTAALREIWIEQTENARTRLAELTAALRDDAPVVDAQVVWGDPVSEAHRLARAVGAGLIIFPYSAGRGLLSEWPGNVARRLTRDAPCSVLLARVAAECAAADHRMVPMSSALPGVDR
jgi:nucleotide-binding universal stress UspA family protein